MTERRPNLRRPEFKPSPKQLELRELLNEWDPIGVMHLDWWPRDEYDCLFGLLTRLERGATPAEVTRYLERRLVHHFRLDPKEARPDQFAALLVEWHRATPR